MNTLIGGEMFLGVPLFVWGVGCLVVAGIFAVFWPRNKAPATRARYLVVRWGHSLVWFLLGLSCFIRGLGAGSAADGIAFLALPVYLSFLFALVTGKRGHAGNQASS